MRGRADSRQVSEETVQRRHHHRAVENASASVSSVQVTLVSAQTPPPFIAQATANVTAAAPGRTTLPSVAQVRAAQGDASSSSSSLVVDFGSQRTVSALAGPATIQSVQPWLGTRFGHEVANLNSDGAGGVTFDEVLTERLLLTLERSADPATFAAGGSVVIPTPPTNLEVLVGNTRVWFKAGPAVGDQGGSFSNTIDVTQAVASAVSAGALPVVVTLRAAAPGLLTLTANASLLERYLIAFPEGVARTVDAPSEGVYSLSLPISAAAVAAQAPAGTLPDQAAAGRFIDTWQVQQVVFTVKAKLPPTRILPPAGPNPSSDAHLGLDPDHGFIVRLPPGRTDQLGQLSGVRLLVCAGPSGAEVAGTLYGERTSNPPTPGDQLPKGQLGPVTLQPPAQTSAPPGWIDLKLATPRKLAEGDVVWIELQGSSGSLVWSLADPQSDGRENAVVQRRTANGTYTEISKLQVTDPPWSAALRVVGDERSADPVPGLSVAVHGDTATTPVQAIPTPGGVPIDLTLRSPAAPQLLGSGPDRQLSIDLTISTPGSYGVSSAELRYTATSGGTR